MKYQADAHLDQPIPCSHTHRLSLKGFIIEWPWGLWRWISVRIAVATTTHESGSFQLINYCSNNRKVCDCGWSSPTFPARAAECPLMVFIQWWLRRMFSPPRGLAMQAVPFLIKTGLAGLRGKSDQPIWKVCWISNIARLILPVVLKCCRHTWLTKLSPSPWRHLRHWQRLFFFCIHRLFHGVTELPDYKGFKCLVLLSTPVCPFLLVCLN